MVSGCRFSQALAMRFCSCTRFRPAAEFGEGSGRDIGTRRQWRCLDLRTDELGPLSLVGQRDFDRRHPGILHQPLS